jgi:uncharacterized membrane-anchored protein
MTLIRRRLSREKVSVNDHVHFLNLTSRDMALSLTDTFLRETRLYHKGSPQNAYECFETTRLAAEPALLKRFVFLLGAERVVPEHRDCHLYELFRASESVGRELTNQFYAL